MAVNSAAAIGPIIGAYLAGKNSAVAFKIIGLVYLILGLTSVVILSNPSKKDKGKIKEASYKELLNILKNDTLLQLLMFISLIIWIIYSQLDTTLAQYLSSSLDNGIKIYSLMLIINAIGCVSLQILFTQLTNKITGKTLSFIAMILFAVGYILIACFLHVSLLILAAILIMLAEIIIMPFNDFLITKIAPSERIGTYYGALSLAMLGLGLGPMMGGFMYQIFGAKTLFLSCSACCVITIFLYKKLDSYTELDNIKSKKIKLYEENKSCAST